MMFKNYEDIDCRLLPPMKPMNYAIIVLIMVDLVMSRDKTVA